MSRERKRRLDPNYRAKQREWNRAWHQAKKGDRDRLARKAAQMNGYRDDPELRPRHKARWIVNRRIKSGKLVPQPCEVCGGKAQAHHDDYSKPLDVQWLCSAHHAEHHAKARGE